MADSQRIVPGHLRRFVVEQDYAAYTAIDQAVWRFVLLHTRARLVDTAHPAYREGLAATGISVDRIPSIAEMNERLGRFGWGAVCVDGFIPPRAFQEFQARGLLPIAADVRTREHLVYTPAPDIIHEAAGHAPILPEPAFAAYLRRIGEIGKRAFTVPEDDGVFQAIHTLSEVKEDLSQSPERVAEVEADLTRALALVPRTSEATWLSRLYWWTAEYGLFGTPEKYLLYGAGLISSLGESHSCHDPNVRKLPLDERCVEVGYDVTRPQPQLFVTPSFEALHEVLDRVAKTLAVELGGAVAIERALRSGELASFRFGSGVWAIGVLAEVGPTPAEPAWLRLTGPVAFAWDGRLGKDRAGPRPEEHWVLTGRLANGCELSRASESVVDGFLQPSSGRHRVTFRSGASVEGRLLGCVRDRAGRLLQLDFEAATLTLPGHAAVLLPHYTLLGAGEFVTAQAGAIDPDYHADSAFPGTRVPQARVLSQREQAMLASYRALAAGTHDLASLHAALEKLDPEEWLLRWNLLERAHRFGQLPLANELRRELERLELHFGHQQPIASGLRYLATQFG
jgi:phenylalanine-4-hydroxylase